MKQIILFVRHGHPKFPSGRLSGRTENVRLSTKGQHQCAELARGVKDVEFKAIISSPITRCVETAEFLSDSRPLKVTTDERLSEIDFGTWQGRRFADLRKTKLWQSVQNQPSQVTFPSGESFIQAQRRGVDATEALRSKHKEGTSVIVAHCDLIKLIVAHYLGIHIDMFQRIVIAYASVSAVAFGDEFPRVLSVSSKGFDL